MDGYFTVNAEIDFRLTQFSEPTKQPIFQKSISEISLKSKQTQPKCLAVGMANCVEFFFFFWVKICVEVIYIYIYIYIYYFNIFYRYIILIYCTINRTSYIRFIVK